jgi:hypothetical protein
MTALTAPKTGLWIVPGCFEPHHARQFCDGHYQTWRRTGETPPGDLTARVRWQHDAEVECFTFMAQHGHLTAAERERIAERGEEARKRIAIGRERKEALGEGFGGDRLLVAIAEAR